MRGAALSPRWSSWRVLCPPVLCGVLACGAGADVLPTVDPGAAQLSSGRPSALSRLEEVTGFGSNPGRLRMWIYVPADLPAPAPLVVALHGCSQDAAEFSAAGFNWLADVYKAVVLYPEQVRSNNFAGCFNWSEDTTRQSGENTSIMQMVEAARAKHAIDPGKVFVAGFSAGGAQAAQLLATRPEVFAAGAVFAGVPYGCARNLTEGLSCTFQGVDHTPQEWAAVARAGAPAQGSAWPRVSLWHGTADAAVAPLNQAELVEQWTELHGIDRTPDLVQSVPGAERAELRDGAGFTRVETYRLLGKGHVFPVSPKDGCGTAGPFIEDMGLCAVARLARFFGLQATQGGDDDAGDGASGGGPGSGSGGGGAAGSAEDGGVSSPAGGGAGTGAERPDGAKVGCGGCGSGAGGVEVAGWVGLAALWRLFGAVGRRRRTRNAP